VGFWSGKQVLVTGGASFIGSHVVEQLLIRGARIRVADNLSSGSLGNLAGVMDQIEFCEGDLCNQKFADDSVANCDVVFHLAANHGGRGYIDTHPVECSSNMILDGVVFAAAHAGGVERVCFTSSACVYPTNLQDSPQLDNMIYLKEEWADPFKAGAAASDGEYGWAKLMGEMTLRAYHKQYGMKGVSCRLFTVYGERENETHAIIALIAKAFVKMDPYEIWGTGEQDRNFTYVGDIVEGIIRAAENIEDASSINIGTAEHIRIKDVVQHIFQYTGFIPRELFFDINKPIGVFSRSADLMRCRQLLNWEPQTSFRDGLARTIDWYYRTHSITSVTDNLNVLLTER